MIHIKTWTQDTYTLHIDAHASHTYPDSTDTYLLNQSVNSEFLLPPRGSAWKKQMKE